MTRYMRTDAPELIEHSESSPIGRGVFTRYQLDGTLITTGEVGDPPGDLVTVADDPYAAALWAAADRRRQLADAERTANRLSNELAHTKAIANGVQNSLRDQLGEARHDRDAMTDARLADHREFWREAVTMRVESEYTRQLNADKNAEIHDLQHQIEQLRGMLCDTAANLDLPAFLTDAPAAAIAHAVANHTHELHVAVSKFAGRTAADLGPIVESIARTVGVVVEGRTFTEVIDDTKRRAGIARQVVEVIEAPTTQDHPDDAVIEYAREAVEAIGHINHLAVMFGGDVKPAQLVDYITAQAEAVSDLAAEQDELAQALGIVAAADPAETPTILDRARQLLADRDELERKVEHAGGRILQLTDVNQSLRATIAGATYTNGTDLDARAAAGVARLLEASDRQRFVPIIKGTARETVEYQISGDDAVDHENSATLLLLMQGCANGEFRAVAERWQQLRALAGAPSTALPAPTSTEDTIEQKDTE